MSGNLYSILRSGFGGRLGEACLVAGGGTVWTYGDVDWASARFAALLKAAGVAPGDRVAVQVDKSPEAVALYLACLRAGAVFVPLNTAYTPAEVGYFLKDAAPKLFVCRPASEAGHAPVAAAAGVPLTLTLGVHGDGTLVSGAGGLTAQEGAVPRAADDLAAILYTSGTTGRSKGAMLSHGNLSSNGLALVALWRFTDRDVLLHALPIFHVHGLFVALHCAMLSGAAMLFLPKFEVAAVRQALPGASVMMGVPTFYTRLMEEPDFSAEECARVRLFVSGSAPLAPQAHRAFEARTGHRILERYGMTEAGMITSNPYDGARIAGTVGHALPGVSVRVRDAGGNAVTDAVGMIEVKGPNVFRGYWNMPEKTAEEFTADGYFITGDLGSLAPDGRLTIVGRGKDLIISGGYNIYPKEIETVLDAIPGVVESAVVGVPHADFGEGVVAEIVTADGSPLDAAAIRAVLDTTLARFKHPKALVFVDDLPRNAMGKVQKALIREKHKAIFAR